MRHIRLCSRIQAPHHLRATVIASLLIFGCGDKGEDTASGGSGPGSDVYDGPPVSFEEALTEVLVPSCGFDSCHGSGAGYFRVHENQTEAEYLELMSTVLITRQMVIPGNAATSYLIKKMEGSTDIEGQAMPPPNGGLSGYSIGRVRSWIDNIEPQ